MSFWNVPAPSTVRIETKQVQDPGTYNQVPALIPTIEIGEEQCPSHVQTWLEGKGWHRASSHPDTNEPLFQKQVMKNVPDIGEVDITDGQYYRWHEAIAWEFYFFMSIGGP